MKKMFFHLIACTLFLGTSCEKENIENLKHAYLNTPFTSAVNEKVYLKNTSSELTIEVKSISDLRCPIHSNPCLDPGECAVRIQLSNLNNSTAETILHLGNTIKNQTDSISLQLDHKIYVIHLDGVNPKPSDEEKDTQKTAEFIIKN